MPCKAICLTICSLLAALPAEALTMCGAAQQGGIIRLQDENLDKIKFVGYAFQIEMKYRAFVHKFNIVEVPIIFTDRTKGQSKMSGGIIREAVVGVILLRLRKIFNTL